MAVVPQLYDAVYLASNELMKKQQGRKALIILSDGVDRGSKTYLEGAIESAQRADTVVYSIYFADPHRTIMSAQIRAAEWDGAAAVGLAAVVAAGRVAAVAGRAAAVAEAVAEASVIPKSRTDGKKILERISKETGGRFFEVSKKQSVGDIYDSIVEELRTQYNMGYTPDKDSAATGYHHIQLAVKKKDLTRPNQRWILRGSVVLCRADTLVRCR